VIYINIINHLILIYSNSPNNKLNSLIQIYLSVKSQTEFIRVISMEIEFIRII